MGGSKRQKAKLKSVRNWMSLILVAQEAACLYCSNERIRHPSVSKKVDVRDLTLGKVGRAAFEPLLEMLPCCQFGTLLLLWKEWWDATQVK